MTRAAGFALGIAIVLATAHARADPDPCARVRCSEHGACMIEDREPFCFCDEGYSARALTCIPVQSARAPEPGSMAGSRIVSVAAAEVDRGPRQVGLTNRDAPFDLGRYVRPGELWCSEFISWVYRSAGIPFTSGYEGGWLLTNNAAIRRWFERRGQYVARGSAEWRSFQPLPGDYVRIHTRRGHGHSAIVRYVSGDTLYTIEGNVSNHVRLRTHRRFRDDARIDGIGIVTLPTPRRTLLARLRSSPPILLRATSAR